MKRIGYIILTVLMFIVFINNASASTCAFGNTTLYFECSNSGGEVTCTIEGSNSSNVSFATPTGPMASGYEIAIDEAVITSCRDNSTIYATINSQGEVIGLYSEEPISGTVMAFSKMDNDDYESTSVDLSAYNGNSCIYTLSPYKYVCTITNGKPVCTMGFMDGVNASNFDVSSVTQTLTASDFLDSNGNFTCTKNGQYVEACYSTNNAGVIVVSSVMTECSGNGARLSYSPNASDFDGNAGYNEDEEEASSGGSFTGSENSGGGRNDGESTDGSDVVENFCTGSRLGVFTTIGWVFWFVKIAVPILLMVFGAIDLGRAVVASKDDEIKKSTIKLVKRAIAGIIIFFIPTIINLIVDVINGDDVYNGSTFATCTKCVLEPNNSICPGLGGD